MTNQQLVDHGNQMMDETDQATDPVFLNVTQAFEIQLFSVYMIVQETIGVGTETAAALKAQKSFQDLLRKQEGDRAMWEYPFAVAGVNITFMLIQMLDLEAVKPRTLVGAIFVKFLAENESAFDLLYCITFKLLDHQWLQMHASYMDFNSVMKATRRQLERELLLEDLTRLEDLPSYSFLAR